MFPAFALSRIEDCPYLEFDGRENAVLNKRQKTRKLSRRDVLSGILYLPISAIAIGMI